jgi:hypothetical protein
VAGGGRRNLERAVLQQGINGRIKNIKTIPLTPFLYKRKGEEKEEGLTPL